VTEIADNGRILSHSPYFFFPLSPYLCLVSKFFTQYILHRTGCWFLHFDLFSILHSIKKIFRITVVHHFNCPKILLVSCIFSLFFRYFQLCHA